MRKDMQSPSHKKKKDEFQEKETLSVQPYDTHDCNQSIVNPKTPCLRPKCPRDGAHEECRQNHNWSVYLCKGVNHLLLQHKW